MPAHFAHKPISLCRRATQLETCVRTNIRPHCYTGTPKACSGLQVSFHVQCVCQNGPIFYPGESNVATTDMTSNKGGWWLAEEVAAVSV